MYRQPTQWKARQPRISAPYARVPVQLTSNRQSPTSFAQAQEHDRDNFDEVAQMARSAYKLGRELLGELNTESKVIEAQTAITPDYNGTTANSVVTLNACSQGDTDTTRNGDSIKMSNLMLRGHVSNLDTALSQTSHYWVRCTVILEKGITTVLKPFPTSAATTDGLFEFAYSGTNLADVAPKDYDLNAGTKILFDRKWLINQHTLHHSFEELIKVNHHTQYENNSAAPATGALKVIWTSNVSTGSALRPTVNYGFRVYFVDN